MSIKKKVQIVSVLMLIASGILLLPFVEWRKTSSVFGYIVLLLGVAGSLVSIFIPKSFTYYFREQDWQSFQDEGVVLQIKENQHGMGKSPICEVMHYHENGYEVIICDIKHSEEGIVSIHAAYPFKGKVSIH